MAVIAYYRWNTNFVNQPAEWKGMKETREVLAGIKEGERVEVPGGWEYGGARQVQNILACLY